MRLPALLLVALLTPASVPAETLRIMPLGDSITEGAAGDATYRYWLQRGLEAEGMRIDFVGSRHGVLRGEPRFADFDPDHEGHTGWTTQEVLEQIGEWARVRPDLVLLHLGTNDLGRDPGAIAPNLAAIIDALRRENPKVTILLARIIPTTWVSRTEVARVNDAIAAMAAKKEATASPLIVVDHFRDFDPAIHTRDGTHPNEAGEKLMAKRWLEAIRKASPPPVPPAAAGSS